MPSRIDILIVGDSMVDITIRPREFEVGGANPSDIVVSPGGLANIAVAAKSVGSKTGFLGRIGRDVFGDFYEHDLVSNGIKSLLVRSLLPTGICINFVTDQGERTMYTSQGANKLLASRDLDRETLSLTEMVFVSGFSMETSEAALEIVKIAKRSSEMGKKVAVGGGASNIISKRTDLFKRLVLEYADYLLINEDEAAVLTGEGRAEKAIKALEPLCETIVVTRGPGGSITMIDGEIRDFKSPEVEVLDTTGAGDVFAGVFMDGIIKERPWGEIIARAHSFASRSVTKLGPRSISSNPK